MPACTMCGWQDDRPIAQSWKLEAIGWIPSGHQLGKNNKNGFKYRTIRNRFKNDLEDQLNTVPRANKFRAAVITRLYGKTEHGRWCRAYDLDNIITGCKPLVDTLKAFAVILDDRDDTFRGYYRQERSADGVDRYTIQLLEYEIIK